MDYMLTFGIVGESLPSTFLMNFSGAQGESLAPSTKSAGEVGKKLQVKEDRKFSFHHPTFSFFSSHPCRWTEALIGENKLCGLFLDRLVVNYPP
jgi:hypothetical protein